MCARLTLGLTLTLLMSNRALMISTRTLLRAVPPSRWNCVGDFVNFRLMSMPGSRYLSCMKMSTWGRPISWKVLLYLMHAFLFFITG